MLHSLFKKKPKLWFKRCEVFERIAFSEESRALTYFLKIFFSRNICRRLSAIETLSTV